MFIGESTANSNICGWSGTLFGATKVLCSHWTWEEVKKRKVFVTAAAIVKYENLKWDDFVSWLYLRGTYLALSGFAIS